MFENVTIPVHRLVELAQHTLTDHTAATDTLPRRHGLRGDGKWKLPGRGFMKLNTDASCRQDWGTGFGRVLRDSEAHVR